MRPSEISTPLLQNMGTVGGNLLLDTRCNYYDQGFEWRKAINFCMKKDGDTCWVAPSSPRCWAVQSSDLAPVMVALDARVVLAGPDGERTIPAAALYHDDGMAFLTKRPEELLVRIEVPALAGARASYRKLRRRGAFDFPVLGVAAWASFDGAGKVAAARIVLGAVGSHPKLVADAAAALVGGTLDDDQLDEAARLAAQARQAARQHRLHDRLAKGHGAGVRAAGAGGTPPALEHEPPDAQPDRGALRAPGPRHHQSDRAVWHGEPDASARRAVPYVCVVGRVEHPPQVRQPHHAELPRDDDAVPWRRVCADRH